MYRHFHQLDTIEQVAQRNNVVKALAPEIEANRYRHLYASPKELVNDIHIGTLVHVAAVFEEFHFGITNPIRTRIVNRYDTSHEQSYPYLRPATLTILKNIAHTTRCFLLPELRGVVDDIAVSVTSLTRTTMYQDHLNDSGKLASSEGSSHCSGNAFDIDHTGFYAKIDSVWKAVHPGSDIARVEYIRPLLHYAIDEALQYASKKHPINAIKELPSDWGVYHIATL